MFEAIVTIVVVAGFGAFLYSKRKKTRNPTSSAPSVGSGGDGGDGGSRRSEIGIVEHEK